MDAVKEAQIEQRLDDLSRQFARAEERNYEEHREIRAEIAGLRAEMNDGFRAINTAMHSYNRTLIVTMGSLLATIVASLGAAAASFLS